MPLGAAGKRVRLVAIERRKRGFGSAGAARSVVKVAIGNEHLAEVWPNYIRLFFALSREKYSLFIRLKGWPPVQPSPLETPQRCHRRRSRQSPILYWEAPLSDVHILIVDDDAVSQHALQQVFDSEGWRVCVVPFASEAMRELARGHWALVIVNIALADITGPLFTTLKELSQVEFDPDAAQKGLRVLFLVPAIAARWARPVLHKERLPYAMKPLNLNDFLDKVSDLLLDAGAIPRAIRDVSLLSVNKERRQKDRRSGRDRRNGKMFASREDYMMTEEEIAEYEKQEEEERKKHKEEEKKREML